MLSNKLLLLLIGSIAISSCLATEEDWGLDGEAYDINSIDELLGRKLTHCFAKGQWRFIRRVV